MRTIWLAIISGVVATISCGFFFSEKNYWASGGLLAYAIVCALCLRLDYEDAMRAYNG